MSVPKAKALLTVCAALLLCGCGQALSEREIVRAVFFARQQGAYSACLLLADQNTESDGVQYKTTSARGNTAAQALHLFLSLELIQSRDTWHAALRQGPARAGAFGFCAGHRRPQLGRGRCLPV